MNNKVKIAIISICIVFALALSFTSGCTLDIFRSSSNTTSMEDESQDLNLELLEEAYKIILDNYVESDKIDTQKLNDGILKGLIQGLDDPYSSYLTKEQYDMSISDFSGQFEGIGAYVGAEDGRVTIIAPIPDTPAAKAGIRSGDVILEVNGETVTNISVTEVVLLIRGPKGTTVELTILHEGDSEPITLEIVRAEIQIPSVVLVMDGDYAHITITNFTERTAEELLPVMETISENGAEGIVLDLRSNPGGYLTTVVEVASYFIDRGTVVSVVYPSGITSTDSVNERTTKIDLPMVVLVDRYSASGSEVLAGALQDYERAHIAGETTYGKGSVNQLRQLSDGSGIYITIARWATPNGNIIEGQGIEPDTELDYESVDGVQWAIDYLVNQN